MSNEKIYVVAGGTVVHVSPHFALSAPAYGKVGAQISERLAVKFMGTGIHVVPLFTAMAEGSRQDLGVAWRRETQAQQEQLLAEVGIKRLETNDDLQKLVSHLVEQEETRGIVLAAAVCDWQPISMSEVQSDPDATNAGLPLFELVDRPVTKFGKDQRRLRTKGPGQKIHLNLSPTDKIVTSIRKGETGRKDIYLVSFKTTAGEWPENTYAAGLKHLKTTSSNLVLANDVQTGTNVVVTPEEFPYYATDRESALDMLCDILSKRIHLDFVRTKVLEGPRADILHLDAKGDIPSNFLPVFEHLIDVGAYKALPWSGVTTGHFGCRVENQPYTRISSCRRTNHNRAFAEGVAKIYGRNEAYLMVRVSFFEGTRSNPPERRYSPTIVFKGEEEHHSVALWFDEPVADTTYGAFEDADDPLRWYEQSWVARMHMVRPEIGEDKLLRGGQEFSVYEGPQCVGFGTIETVRDVIMVVGARPSVGEHTQSQIYAALGDKAHSIVHFHCSLKGVSERLLYEARQDERVVQTPTGHEVTIRSQVGFECGSVQCGDNTVAGMREVLPGIYVCHLDGHGPNIAFHRDVDPNTVIQFIDANWDLAHKSGGDLP